MAAREWVVWDEETAADRPDVVDAVERFVSLDTDAGRAAARFVREEALANDGSTRTWLLVGAGRLEGYVSLCAGQVDLDATQVAALGLPPGRHRLPAVILAWIARHRDTDVAGTELIRIAFAIAQRASRQIGAIAFALDPGDDAIARVWQADPYGFRRSKRGNRLWLPLNPEA